MIHNKYFEVLKQFLGNYAKEVYGRSLIGKVSLSQKGIALALEELEQKGVLKTRKEGTLKHYGLNMENTEIKDIVATAEIARKLEFMGKERKIAHAFKEGEGIIGIFGSYAKNIQKGNSDLDIFIIGGKNSKYAGGKELGLQISAKHFSRNEWINLLKEKNNLCREILENHIILFGTEDFISLAWRNYHGFS
ncbi:MAG: nucleotidyltransferase domain-containing protein [Nanoarchaeota archaeon]